MTLYSIFEKPHAKATSEGPVAIAEKFSWLAALLPPVFALAHGLWLMLIVWIALVAALILGADRIGEDAATNLYLLAAVFFGIFAGDFRRAALKSRGWLYRGEVIAAAEDLAETEALKHS